MKGSARTTKGKGAAALFFIEPFLFLHLRSTVEKKGEGCGPRIVELRRNQEPIPVAADGVREHVIGGYRLPAVDLKQSDRGAGLEAGGGGHLRRHHLSVRGQIEQFAPVLPPSRLLSTSARDLPLAGHGRKRRNVNLQAPGLIRNVGHPAAIGGKLRAPHHPIGLEQWLEFTLRPTEIEQRLVFLEQYVLAIVRPVQGTKLGIACTRDLFLRTGTVGILQIRTKNQAAVRREENLLAIGTPDRGHIQRRVESEPCRGIPGWILDPKVGASLRIGLIGGNPAPVRRELHVVIPGRLTYRD